jgi:hypothetical protein
MTAPMRPYSLLLGDDLRVGLKLLKERDGTPESETIRRALRAYPGARGVISAPRRQPRAAPAMSLSNGSRGRALLIAKIVFMASLAR